jgi:hypothetical protein
MQLGKKFNLRSKSGHGVLPGGEAMLECYGGMTQSDGDDVLM